MKSNKPENAEISSFEQDLEKLEILQLTQAISKIYMEIIIF